MVSRNVLVITGDSIAPSMAGPGIRAVQLGTILGRNNNVRVVTTGDFLPIDSDIFVKQTTRRQLREHANWADVILFQGFILAQYPWLKYTNALLIADLYDPLHLEQLEDTHAEEITSRTDAIRATVAAVTEQLRYADFIICASEKQRDFWLGYLSALGRINPSNYVHDSSLRELIAVVPFGISEEDPVQTRHGIRGVIPGISDTDFLMLWGGGIYNWFDPLTLIRAVHQVSTTHPEVKLFFMGLAHPNPLFTEYSMSDKALLLAEELDIRNKNVFFNESWVPFEERANFLLDANVGVSTHFVHLETAFSFRTRLLDYLWAGLPIIATEGDTFAPIIEHHKLGIVVDENDVQSCVEAIINLIENKQLRDQYSQNVARIRERYRWSKVAEPLLYFVRKGEHSADFIRPIETIPLHVKHDYWIIGKLRGAKLAMREGGYKLVLRKLAGKV